MSRTSTAMPISPILSWRAYRLHNFYISILRALPPESPPEYEMKILGIDPGTVVMGYGVVESEDDELSLVDFGAINVPEHSQIGERLSHLYKELLEIIQRHHPDAVAVEQPFIAKNVRSAMAIGRAQAIALLAAASRASRPLNIRRRR